jgi:predicted nucleic acid-binding protein
MRRILIDSGVLLSYYQQQEPLHQAVLAFFDQNAAHTHASPNSTTAMPICPVISPI